MTAPRPERFAASFNAAGVLVRVPADEENDILHCMTPTDARAFAAKILNACDEWADSHRRRG